MKVRIDRNDCGQELSVIKNILEKTLLAKEIEEDINKNISLTYEKERSNMRLKIYDAQIETLKSHIAFIENNNNLQKLKLEKEAFGTSENFV